MTDLFDVFTKSAAKPTVMCDVDNTLAWTMNTTLSMLNASYHTNLRLEDINAYHFEANLPLEQSTWVKKQYALPITYVNIPPDFHAIDAINTLYERGHHVVIVTSRAAKMMTVTRDWLSEWGVNHHELYVGPTVKLDYAKTNRNLVAIDDDPSVALSLAPLGVDVWIPDRTYTPSWCRSSSMSGVQVFSDWSALVDRLA